MAKTTKKTATKKTAAKAAPSTTAAVKKKTAAKKATVKKTVSKKAPVKKAAASKAAPKKKTVAGARPVAKKAAAKKAPVSQATRRPAERRIITADERRQLIAEAAYLRGESQGFLSDEREDWLLAEAEVNVRLLRAKINVIG